MLEPTPWVEANQISVIPFTPLASGHVFGVTVSEMIRARMEEQRRMDAERIMRQQFYSDKRAPFDMN